MRKLTIFVLILLLLTPQIVFAKDTNETPKQVLDKVVSETSKNWTSDYYDWIEINPTLNTISKDRKPTDLKTINTICKINAKTVDEFLSQVMQNPLYEVTQREGKWIIKNPYQTKRIYIASDFDIEPPETNQIQKTIWYDTKHVIIICKTQQDTFDVYKMIQTRENRTEKTICLDRIISAKSMSEVETSDSEYMSYGFDKLNIDTLKENAVNDVVVGVIDSGITRRHPFFKDRDIKNGISFITGGIVNTDEYGHGTHVTSTIIEGTNKHVSILPIQVFDGEGKTSMIIIDAAIRYATMQKVDCVNMSLGIPQDFIGQFNLLDDSLKEMYESKIPFIKSAGNHSSVVEYDAPSGKYVISVAAIDKNNKLAGFSNYGKEVDFACYGVGVEGAINNMKTGQKSGTSMAAPHITAIVALLKSEDISRDVEDIYKILKDHSIPIESGGLIEGNVLPQF